jgi:translocation and assembly module TamB
LSRLSKQDRKRIKIIVELFFFIPLLIIALLLYYFIDKEVSKRMDVLKTDILSYMEQQLGRKIQYESISPSIFMYLEIRDLKIYNLVSREDEIFRIRKIKIKYNIFSLIFSDNPLTSVSEINISNTLFKFSLKPGQVSERTEFQRTFLSRLLSTTYKFKVTAKNVALILYTDTMLVNSTNLFFTINSRRDSYDINIRRGNTWVTVNNKNEKPVQFFSRFKLKGSISGELSRADLVVRVLHLSSNSFVLEKQTFQVIFKDNNLRLIKIQDKAPVDVQLSLDLPTRELVLNFKTENWEPSGMMKLTGPLYTYNPWLTSALTSSGKVTYNLDTRFLDYTLNASVLLNNPALPPGIVVSTYLYGDKEIAYFKPIVVHSKIGTVNFTGNILFKNFFPEGFLRLVNVKAMQDKRISADFTLDRYEESLSLKGSRMYIGSSGFDEFNLDIYPKYSSFLFDLSSSFAQSKYDDEIHASGELVFDPDFSLRLDSQLDSIPVSHVYKLFTRDSLFSEEIFQFLDNLTMESEFHLSSDFRTTAYHTDRVVIRDHIDTDNFMFFTVRGTGEEAAVNSIWAEWKAFNLTGNAETRFLKKGNISFITNLSLENIPYEMKGYYQRDKMLSITGNYGLDVSIHFNKTDQITVDAKSEMLPFPLSGEEEKVAYTSISLNGIFPESGEWQFDSPGTLFYNLPVFKIKENELKVAFLLNKQELFLSEMTYKDSLSQLTGYGNIQYKSEDQFSITSYATLTGKNTGEYYSVSAVLGAKTINAYIDYINSPLERFGEYIISGSVSGNLHLDGPLQKPGIDGHIALVKGSLVGDHVGFQTNFSKDEAGISFRSVSMSYLDLKIENGEGSYTTTDGQFEFSSVFTGDFINKEILCHLDFSGSFVNKDDQDPYAGIFQKEYEATLSVSHIIVDAVEYDPWSCSLVKKEDLLTVKGGPNNVVLGTFTENGDFEIEVKKPFAVRGFAKGRVKGNTIDSVIERIWFDHTVINTLLGEKVIRFTQGSVYGNNIKISGYFNDPDYTGTLFADNTALSFFLCPLESSPFQSSLFLNEKEVTMEEIAVQMGSGIVYADRVAFQIDHWLPASYDLAFSTDEYIGLYCAYDFDVVKVNGYAVGTVNARGDKNTIWVDGDLVAHYGMVTLSNLLENREQEEENNSNISINLAIKTGRKVEFDWPTANFPVLKCFAERGSGITISYDSVRDDFNMDGKIEIRGGEVFYFNRNFYLKSGNIVFNVVNPGEVDPTVTVLAELREYNEENEEIKIFLIAENNRLSNFSPRFEAQPGLTEYEIYELLGQSLERRFEESGLGLSFVLLSSDVLSETFIFRSFEQTIREMFNLDLFSIRTHVIENILMEEVIGEEREGYSSEDPPLLGRYLDNTTITIGQYIGDDLFISGLVRLKEVDYYTQETFLGRVFSGIEPQLEFSLEWPTPFFNLEWTFNPTQEHLNDLFLYLTDNTIKLEWSFSY